MSFDGKGLILYFKTIIALSWCFLLNYFKFAKLREWVGLDKRIFLGIKIQLIIFLDTLTPYPF